VDVTVRRTVGMVIYLGGLSAVVLYLAMIMTHRCRAQILTGLAACVLLMTVAGAVQYPQMPPQARTLVHRPPKLQALTVSYASFLAAFVMIALFHPPVRWPTLWQARSGSSSYHGWP
jgi:hypothetical protein